MAEDEAGFGPRALLVMHFSDLQLPARVQRAVPLLRQELGRAQVPASAIAPPVIHAADAGDEHGRR